MKWQQKVPKREYSVFDSMTEQLSAIHGIEDVNRFLNPHSDELHDPMLLKNIVKARDVIISAIKNKKNIVIHSDVDTDGIFSTAIMYRYLKHFTDKVSYIHAQRSDGHGVSRSLIDIPENTDLLIIVDSSSNETDECQQISEQGIEIIILDHHEVTVDNPYCTLVNPKQSDCNYPNKDVSGGLVCWKMCQVLDSHFNTYYAFPLIDLAGLSVVADAMNMLIYENRYVAKKAIENIHNIGLFSLIKANKKDIDKFTCTDFLFKISPCVTAATRFDKLEVAIQLMISDDPKECMNLANQLVEINEERKRIQDTNVRRIKSELGEDVRDKCIVLVEPELGKGFNGVVANDISNYYQRPTIILGHSENSDEYHGSFRCDDSINLMDILNGIDEITFAAGHANAGGCGCKKSDLDKLKKSLNEYFRDYSFDQVLEYVMELDESEVSEDMIADVQDFYRICGNGFNSGKFLIKNLFVNGKEPMSKKKPSYESFKIICDYMQLAKFKSDENYFNEVPVFSNIEAIGTLNLNVWMDWKKKRNIVTKQLFMEDYKIV